MNRKQEEQEKELRIPHHHLTTTRCGGEAFGPHVSTRSAHGVATSGHGGGDLLRTSDDHATLDSGHRALPDPPDPDGRTLPNASPQQQPTIATPSDAVFSLYPRDVEDDLGCGAAWWRWSLRTIGNQTKQLIRIHTGSDSKSYPFGT